MQQRTHVAEAALVITVPVEAADVVASEETAAAVVVEAALADEAALVPKQDDVGPVWMTSGAA